MKDRERSSFEKFDILYDGPYGMNSYVDPIHSGEGKIELFQDIANFWIHKGSLLTRKGSGRVDDLSNFGSRVLGIHEHVFTDTDYVTNRMVYTHVAAGTVYKVLYAPDGWATAALHRISRRLMGLDEEPPEDAGRGGGFFSRLAAWLGASRINHRFPSSA